MDNNSLILDGKNHLLKTLYKNYNNFIIKYQHHADRLYSDWVIDISSKNSIMQQLDIMIKQMNKDFNINIKKIFSSEKTEHANCVEMNIIDPRDIDHIVNQMFTKNDQFTNVENSLSNVNNPFSNVHNHLLKLVEKYGCYNLKNILRLHIGNFYHYLFDDKINEQFYLYNSVFVPLSVKIFDKKLNEKFFIVENMNSEYDSLIDNTCRIKISLPEINKYIVCTGYIKSDPLNIHFRTSQIHFKLLFDKKNEVRDHLNEINGKILDGFKEKYFKNMNTSIYYISSTKNIAEIIDSDFKLFTKLTNKKFNLVMKEFAINSIPEKIKYIFLFLLGDDANISTAGLLFNLLKEKKINANTLSDVIYKNLSYYCQIKLKKVSNNIKNESMRLKTLRPENISIEKKLSIIPAMPENVRSYILEKMIESKSSDNNYKVQTAINALLQFPWKPKNIVDEYSDIKKSYHRAREYIKTIANNINDTVYGHENSKRVLIELVGKWIQNPYSGGQVIGLSGPPGVGKTLLAKSLSTALNIPLGIIGLGGMNDSGDLIGHSYTYAGAQYGTIVRQMIKTGKWRSILVFDEVDKVSKKNDTNEIFNTLIHITDPNMNEHFQDRFFSSSVEFDLSGVLIIFTYNDSSKICPILMDRITEIEVSAYGVSEKIAIAENYMIKELCRNIDFDYNKIKFDDGIIKYIIEKYTIEAGVRELKRKIEKILLKMNMDRFYLRGPFKQLLYKLKKNSRDIGQTNSEKRDSESNDLESNIEKYINHKVSSVEKNTSQEILDKIFNMDIENEKIIITKDLVHKYLSSPNENNDKINNVNMIGVISGLYATSSGVGGIVPIQIYKNHVGDSSDGTNLKLKITGNQKQIMKESVICAFTVAIDVIALDLKMSIAEKYPYGFHIHVPDGGTPKDGPSAGCAFAIAFISILLNKEINNKIAITGEIELTGKIRKIGGLYAKLNGAKQAGVSTVYIPEENREDYTNIKNKNPDLFSNDFNIIIVKHILEIATDTNVLLGNVKSNFDQNKLSHKKLESDLNFIKKIET